MRPLLKRVSIVCAATLLLACAERGGGIPAAAPASFGSADEAYVVGRSQHLAQRFDEAVLSYQAALAAVPEHLNARNGLATLYAQRGEFAKAIALWQALTKAVSEKDGPEHAFLFSNLGYAHFLNGEFDLATVALEKACLLDPLNHRAWQHLGSALDKLGQHDRAASMFRQANALKGHDFKADYAIAERAGVAPIDTAVQSHAPGDGQWAETEVRETGSGMFVLRRVGRTAPRAQAPLAAGLALPRGATAMLEIRNGNGVNGMARAIAGEVGSSLRVVRLSNQKGFGVMHTRVEYQPAFREAAERLAGRFGAARVVPVASVGRADLRLVIGRDMARGSALKPG